MTARRIGYLVCVLLVASGVILLILGLNNVLALAFIIGGLSGVVAVANSKYGMIPPPTGANNIEGDAAVNRLLGSRDED